jgi:tRNA A37 threonylcarbamoyladenosine synthetase subunit TsaC/SUA5/YrdC
MAMKGAEDPGEGDEARVADEPRPPLVAAGAGEVMKALQAGAVVAVPNVGGYCLAVRAGSVDDEAKLVELAADPDGPHYAVGQIEDLRSLTSGWTDELGRLLERCWPGPLEVFVPWSGSDGPGPAEEEDDGRAELGGAPSGATPEYGVWAAVVGMPDGRALRRLCREHGPWRTVPLTFTEPAEVTHAFGAADVAVVVDGGRREGPLPTLVDATVTPIRVLREGALPASFIEGTMLMSTRRRLFSRNKRPDAD